MSSIKIIFLALLLLSSGLLAAKDDFVVIVNKNTSFSSLSAVEIRSIFLSRTRYSPDSVEWYLVDHPDNGFLKHRFYELVTGKDKRALRAYRIKRSFAGKIWPPKILSNSYQIKNFVRNNKNAIAYIPRSELDDSVKTIFSYYSSDN